jgi:hypothetical protein
MSEYQYYERFTASIRPYLLAGVLRFVRAARNVEGVVRIALIGSLATDKLNPKDADLLVTIRDDADLAPLAALGANSRATPSSATGAARSFSARRKGRILGAPAPGKIAGSSSACAATRSTAACGRTFTTISRPSPYPLRSSPRRRSNSGRRWWRVRRCRMMLSNCS